ncbi:MAG: lauroyl acyltransferase [Rhodospirillaceae bacterium]|nr:lauroyl acyltransferase [Rhodospirillaceae bacterium]
MADLDPKATAGSAGAAAPAENSAPAAKPIKLRHYIEAGLVHALMFALRRMSLPIASGFGGWLSRTLGPVSRPWRIAKKNISRAFPDLSANERRRVVRDAFDNFGRVMAEYAIIPRLWRSRWDNIIDVQGKDGLQWAVLANKPAIVFTAHIGNWELIPMALASYGKPAMLVYRAPNNPLVDTIIARVRERYAAALAPKGADGLRSIVEHIQAGGTVFMVVDQKTNTGPEIPFFGRGARTGKAIARIAMKHGCKLIPAHSERVGRAQFRITFEQPWSVEGNASDAQHVNNALIRINAKIEEWVRAAPGQWMWMHKRWPD